LNAGWSEQAVRTAIMACTVPSSAQVDRELNKSTTPVGTVAKPRVNHLPTISGDKDCVHCDGSGVIIEFDVEAQQHKSRRCVCYQERYQQG